MAELSDQALDALACAISERLQTVVPEAASPSVSAADVWWRLDALVSQAGDFEDNLVAASLSILNHAQDEIIRDLMEGWPGQGAERPMRATWAKTCRERRWSPECYGSGTGMRNDQRSNCHPSISPG